jgi:hypothetical protein
MSKRSNILLASIEVVGILVSGGLFIHTQQLNQLLAAESSYPKAIVDYDGFMQLTSEVKAHRATRLIDFDTFLKYAKEPNTVILDTRSDDRYKSRHIKGAIHLSFTDFTQENLDRLLKSKDVRILIYCNNNFEGDQQNFATKMPTFRPAGLNSDFRPVSLALNIPTYINLYGYGYRNVYELNELVNVNDSRVEFANAFTE